MNKIRFFTLIELITVIVVIGILVAIVVPNISDLKKESLTGMVKSNTHILQTAVDAYALKKGSYPTNEKPTLENPQVIDISKLYPDYINSEPDYHKLKEQKYWVDVYGKVWGATVGSPKNIYQGGNLIEWNHDEKVMAYNLYQVVSNSTTGKVERRQVKLPSTYAAKDYVDRVQVAAPENQFLLSSIDEFGLESAPAGVSSKLNSDWFSPLRDKEGTFTFEIESKDVMYWEKFYVVEDKPEGTNIQYSFSVKDKKGNYGDFISNFHDLEPSKGIQVKVKMTGYNGKLPTLWDMQVHYNYGKEELEEFVMVSSTNLSNSKAVNPNLPVKVVEEFTLPEVKNIKDIKVNDFYVVAPLISYSYKPKNEVNYSPVNSFSEVPAGSTIKVEKEFPKQADLFVLPTLIEYKEGVHVERLSLLQTGVPSSNTQQWETVQRMNFFAHSGDSQVTDWLSIDTVDNQPEDTRIVYKFAISNGSGWSGEYEIFEDVPNSKSIRVSAYLQVKKEKLETGIEPSVTKVVLTHERGTVEVSQSTEGNVFPELTNFESSGSCSNAPASNVNDGDINTMWNACGYAGWVQYTFKEPTLVKGIQIVNEATPSTNQTFTFKGYKDGQWIDLGSQQVYTDKRPHYHDPMYVKEDTYEIIYVHVNGGSSWAAIREILLVQ